MKVFAIRDEEELLKLYLIEYLFKLLKSEITQRLWK